ncbi:sentrin-specific protease-like isoform X2 [Syngnathus typhle]|uniref:sentrin-specific protease-like isoform X2 n=1 Tax=Syngnathus typhle TaxID=161592 RepID=UPI002A6A91F8|nr:sentrin-specific protease-like isoform X2 [Syngnathus typhle]
MNVRPNSELESEVINAYLLLLVNKRNKISVEKVSYIDSFAMTNLWNGKSQRLKINPVEYKLIVGIVNEHKHWKLAAIMPGEKRSLLVDPLGESQMDIKKCLESTRAFMRKKGCNVSRWTCGTVPHPRQQDSTSCGVFALKFAEHLLSDEEIDLSAKANDVNRYRLQIATTLLLETDDLSNLCCVCGEATHDTDNRWVIMSGLVN